MIGLINQRRPASACSRKSSLIRVYTNCLYIATFTCLSRKACECKSLRRCCHCERARGCVCAVGGGGNNHKKEFVVCSMFDVINIVARNGNIFIQFICFASRLNLLCWSVVYTCTVPCSHNETSICNS